VYDAAPAPARIFTSEGRDITGLVTQGQLGGLLEMRNQILASLVGDAYHEGDLNRLAKAVADRINGLLTSGLVSDGPPPVAGVPLFTYNSASDATVAQTLALDPAATAYNLAAIQPGPPYISNGIALALAELAEPRNAADKIDGYSYAEFFGRVAGRVGSRLAQAQADRDFRADTVAQARELRQQISGVSLDQEAMLIIQFQRAYQANARMLSLISALTEEVMGLIR
jgi:flagellar hook-associated protein 1 FlgK